MCIWIYNAHTQWNATLPFGTTWMELRVLCLVKKAEKDKYCIISLI